MAIGWKKVARDLAPGFYINPREFEDSDVREWVAARWRHRAWRVRQDWLCLRINNGSGEKDSMRTIAIVHQTLVTDDNFKQTKRTVEDLCLARWG